MLAYHLAKGVQNFYFYTGAQKQWYREICVISSSTNDSYDHRILFKIVIYIDETDPIFLNATYWLKWPKWPLKYPISWLIDSEITETTFLVSFWLLDRWTNSQYWLNCQRMQNGRLTNLRSYGCGAERIDRHKALKGSCRRLTRSEIKTWWTSFIYNFRFSIFRAVIIKSNFVLAQ